MEKFAFLIGRILLVAIFVQSGVSKFLNLPGLTGTLAGKGIPLANIAAPVAAGLEVGAALLVIVGLYTRYAALALILFTVAATVLFHDFWAMQGTARASNIIQVWKNAALVGGLLMLAAAGGGPFSLTRR